MAGHRSTLKKQNKSFKSGHSSKRSIKAQNKGKIEKNLPTGNKSLKIEKRNDRKNKLNQLKLNKINKNLIDNSIFNSNKIERIITILPLTNNLSILNIINQILSSIDYQINEEISNNQKIITISIDRFKSTIKFIIPNMNNLIDILDSCKISDFVLFALSSIEEVDPIYGEQIIRSVEAQGISTTFAILPDIVENFPKKNLQLDIYKSLLSYYKHFFPNVEKLFLIENKNDSLNLLRNLCQKIPKGINWRDSRGYLLADELNFDDNSGTLLIDGIVRGKGFNINGLIHLPGFGDYQIEKIEKINSKNNNIDIIIPDNRESLNPLNDDNTTNEIEMDDDDDDEEEEEDYYSDDDDWNLVNKEAVQKRTRLPKGMSEYQARWLKDEEIEKLIEENGLEGDDEDEQDDDDEMEEDIEQDDMEEDIEEAEFIEDSPEEHQRKLEEYRKKEREEMIFPDEIELRYDEIATERLSKYRGVKSLASCFWDYDENDERRPINWLNYLRNKNYKIFKNQLMKKYNKIINVKAGDKIRISISFNVNDKNRLINPKLKPFIIYSLLPNENKLSVCNFSIKTWESYDEPIKSKESMIVQYGFRRYKINPLISQQSRNSNNVSKFQRFLHKGQIAIATAILPINYTNSPALFFKCDNNGNNMQILCQGTFENSDFTRILAKRVVITGEVFKIHKNVVTIRFMFHNSNDVNAYKNIPLFSKMGRSGFIKEALGTHGLFKASFDSKLNQQDIIGMELFKRVWPIEGSPVDF